MGEFARVDSSCGIHWSQYYLYMQVCAIKGGGPDDQREERETKSIHGWCEILPMERRNQKKRTWQYELGLHFAAAVNIYSKPFCFFFQSLLAGKNWNFFFIFIWIVFSLILFFEKTKKGNCVLLQNNYEFYD